MTAKYSNNDSHEPVKTNFIRNNNHHTYQKNNQQYQQSDQFEMNSIIQNLHIYQQKHILSNFVYLIESKIYWQKFNVFKYLTYSPRPYQKRKWRNNQLKIVLISQLVHNFSDLNLKRKGLQAFKTYNQTQSLKFQQKVSFLSIFIFNQNYKNISSAFLCIKNFSNHSKKISSSRFSQLFDKNKGLISRQQNMNKFEKQGHRLKLRILILSIRNFVFKKYLFWSFNTLKYHTPSIPHVKFQDPHFKNKSKLDIEKDQRFVKKKIYPHKIIQGVDKAGYIQNLSKISIGNEEVESIRRKDFLFINTMDSFFYKKIFQINFFVFEKLKPFSSQDIQKASLDEEVQLAEPSDESFIFTSVLHHFCYLSGKLEEKFEKTKQKYGAKQGLAKLFSLFSSCQKRQLGWGFYSLKWSVYHQKVQILQKITSLQSLKQQYLAYFNQDQDPSQTQPSS